MRNHGSARWIFLAALLFLLPIFFLPLPVKGFDAVASSRLLLFFGGCLIMAAIGGERGGLWRLNRPLAIFTIYLIAWQVVLRNSSTYFYSYFLPVIAGILAYPYLASIDQDGRRKVFKAVVVMALIQSLMIFGQRVSAFLPPWRHGDLVWPAFHIPPVQMFGKSWLIFYPHDPSLMHMGFGSMPGTNPAAFFLAIAGLLAFAVGWGWASALILPALFLTNCLGGILAGCGGLLYFFWKVNIGGESRRRHRVIVLCAAAMMIIVLICAGGLHGFNDSNRLSTWKVAMQAWWQGAGLPASVHIPWAWDRNPIIGWGPGSFAMFFPAIFQSFTTAAVADGPWAKMHNEPLQILWEFGIVGLIILGFFVRWIWQRMKVETDMQGIGIRAAIVVLAIHSLVFFPFQLTETSLLSLSLIAFLGSET